VQRYFPPSLKKTPGGSLRGAFRGVPAPARLIFQRSDAIRLTHCRLRARALRSEVVQLTAALQVTAIPGTAPTLSHSGDSAVTDHMNIDGMWRDRAAAVLRASTSRVMGSYCRYWACHWISRGTSWRGVSTLARRPSSTRAATGKCRGPTH
jgi:hypothetical protein